MRKLFLVYFVENRSVQIRALEKLTSENLRTGRLSRTIPTSRNEEITRVELRASRVARIRKLLKR